MELVTDIDHGAPVVVRASIEINAPLEMVWDLHSQVTGWPEWFPEIRVAEIDGAFAPGSRVTWGAHGYDALFPAHIGLIKHRRRTVWDGTNEGIYGIHAFTFSPRGNATHIETAESWDSDPGARPGMRCPRSVPYQVVGGAASQARGMTQISEAVEHVAAQRTELDEEEKFLAEQLARSAPSARTSPQRYALVASRQHSRAMIHCCWDGADYDAPHSAGAVRARPRSRARAWSVPKR